VPNFPAGAGQNGSKHSDLEPQGFGHKMDSMKKKLLILMMIFSPFQLWACDTYYSTTGPKRLLTVEEVKNGREVVDNINHFQLRVGGVEYMVDKSMHIMKKDNIDSHAEVGRIMVLPGHFYGEETLITSFLHRGMNFFELGWNHPVKGYIPKIHAIDLEKGKVVSTLNKCGPWNDVVTIIRGEVYYLCEYLCEQKGVAHRFDFKKKKWVKEHKKYKCADISNKKMHQPINWSYARVRRVKPRDGSESATSYLPLGADHCDPGILWRIRNKKIETIHYRQKNYQKNYQKN
jgi:hypothetical protein